MLSTALAEYLEHHCGATQKAARSAGKAIAAAWNDREFWLSPTLTPLLNAAKDSPSWDRPARDVVDELARTFGVHIQDIPAWTPCKPMHANGRPRTR
jgi:hypothetical protein